IPPSPTAAAQRLTEPDRTSPAAKMLGRLVSSGTGWRLFSFHAGALDTSNPVLMNPFSSRSISRGRHSVDLGVAENLDVFVRLYRTGKIVRHLDIISPDDEQHFGRALGKEHCRL